LESEEEDENNKNSDKIIFKLYQNNFNYKMLDIKLIHRLKVSNLLIKFDEYASQKYQDLINQIDDQFMDPITGDIINIPLVLPDTKQIMEKTVIYRILYEKQTNPFNNLPLTIDELNEFNQKEETKEILNDFITNLDKEKEKLKIKLKID
jgi:hypothetical protein